MHSQTLQALRAEIEAVTTLQHAMNRIAQSIDPDAVSLWEGMLLDAPAMAPFGFRSRLSQSTRGRSYRASPSSRGSDVQVRRVLG